MVPDSPQEFDAQRLWTEVDLAIGQWLGAEDAFLRAARESAERAGLPAIAVSPGQGRMLLVLARAIGARRVLEVGTLAGYSALWLARALPEGGRLITLEIDAGRAELARRNLALAGFADRTDVIEGPALASLDAMVAASTPPFDLVFIDADKERCSAYLERAVELSRVGAIIVVDNIVRGGRLADATTRDPNVDGVREMMKLVSEHPRLEASGVQTVGAKGYDGFLMATVVERRIG